MRYLRLLLVILLPTGAQAQTTSPTFAFKSQSTFLGSTVSRGRHYDSTLDTVRVRYTGSVPQCPYVSDRPPGGLASPTPRR